MPKWIDCIDLGMQEYKIAWDFQEKTHATVLERRNSKLFSEYFGSLIFCEHPHVYTLGKSGQTNNLLIDENFLAKINATYYRSNRGGDITYHGPGQIVGYPFLDLE
ncbi:Octanoyltransferase [subsurface metagenome]